jgi:glutamate-1-semialdehyde 2,1-aminomutase
MENNLMERLLEEYHQATPKSRSYSQRAMNFLPGGVTRTLSFFHPYPTYIRRGQGCKVIDVDGNERIDFFNNATSLILGHAHPAVVKAIQERAVMGTAFHAPTALELEMAEILCKRIRSVERVRFTNSGTEAAMMALKAAKAFTGKRKIGKFEGGYHGTSDYVCVSVHPDLSKAGPAEAPYSVPESPDISESILKEVVVMPFNDSEAIERIVKREKGDLACIIVEPMMGAAGIIPARKGFLADLRRIALENDVLLIFDEVQTFRHSWGGAQEICGVTPDMTVLAKIIGGGFPVGAIGGKKEIMEVFGTSSGKAKLPHGGTFNGNPITMAAGLATLNQLSRETYSRLNDLGGEIRKGLSDLMQHYRYKGCVTGETSFFKIHFTTDEIYDYRSAKKCEDKAEQAKIFFHSLNHGIFMESKVRGCLSVPMGKAEIHKLLNVFEDYLKKK